VKKAKKIITDVVKSVQSESCSIKMRKVKVYFSEYKGKECIQSVESKAKCIIDQMGSGFQNSMRGGRPVSTTQTFDTPTTFAELTISGTKVC